jgi:hypothetical protein
MFKSHIVSYSGGSEGSTNTELCLEGSLLLLQQDTKYRISNILKLSEFLSRNMPDNIVELAENEVSKTYYTELDCKNDDTEWTPFHRRNKSQCARIYEQWSDCECVILDDVIPCPGWVDSKCTCVSVQKVSIPQLMELPSGDLTGFCEKHPQGEKKNKTEEMVETSREEQRQYEEAKAKRPKWRYPKKTIEQVECRR